jgi:signal transduction histidine kinase
LEREAGLMTTVEAAAATGPTRSFFERSLPGWHLACYGATAILAFALVVQTDLSAGTRASGLALTALFAGAYTLLGRHILGKDDNVRGSTYLVIVIATTTALLYLTPSGFLLLFIVFPQIWATVSTGLAVAFNALLALGIAISVFAKGGWSEESAVEGALTGVFNLAMALVLGLWITGLISESEKRRALIEELEVTRAQLAIAHHQEGVLGERARLAHEIHDTLAQGFTSLIMLVQAAEAALDDDDAPSVRDRLKLAERTARENLAEARALVEELGPLDLQTATLPDAVRRLTERIGAELGIAADLQVDGKPRALPANAEVVLLRATQEALANIRKHASAQTVHVRLAYDDGTTLEVVDDGCGFEPARAEGFGLRGMRSRVAQVGGELEVASASGRGTTVRVRLP